MKRRKIDKFIVVCIFFIMIFCLSKDNKYAIASEMDETYSYRVGEYSFQTDSNGNVFAMIDGKKYNFSDEWDGTGFLKRLLDLENQNVVYELCNNKIINIYTMVEVLKMKVRIEPDIPDGLTYENGEFSQEKFNLKVQFLVGLQDYFADVDLLESLSKKEKGKLFLTLKKICIQPATGVEFSSSWWAWPDYQDKISEDINEIISINEIEEYKYKVKLSKENLQNIKEYNIEITANIFYEDREKETQEKIEIGNLDEQTEKVEEKKNTSSSGQVVDTASSKLSGIKSAIQFSNDYFSADQKKQINQYVNLWLSELILAQYVEKSDIEKKVTEKIADEWLKKLGVDTNVVLVPGVIDATTFLEVETKKGDIAFIQLYVHISSAKFGKSGFPTMAYGSGSATVYDKKGNKIDSSPILASYADICAFCEQLQDVAESTIFDASAKALNVLGISAEGTAEALSNGIIQKLLNSESKFAKKIFKMVSAKNMRNALKAVTEKAEEFANKQIFKLLTKPSKESTKVSIKCPVNVNVYDSNGNLCGVITDNQVDSAYSDIFMTVVGDQKTIYLVGDDYTFELIGTDIGTMDYIVQEYNEEGTITKEIVYEDVKLSEGCKYYSYVPEAGNLDDTLFELIDVVEITSDVTLTEDLKVDGVLYVKNGTLDLNGHNVIVGRNLYLESGMIRCNEGTLEVGNCLQALGGTLWLDGGTVTVDGDVIFANIDNYGDYTATSNKLTMDNVNDSIHINGNLITCFGELGYYDGAMNCTKGKMYLSGDWKNYGGYIYNSDAFEVIFTSEQDQKIYDPQNSIIRIPVITVKNAEKRNIRVEGSLVGQTLSENVKIKAVSSPYLEFESTNGALDIEGNCTLRVGTKIGGNVAVTGNLVVNDICLDGKNLKVTGNYHQPTGTLYLKGGTMEVGGDVIFANIDNYGDYTECETNLKMDNEKDSITIAGNLITNYGRWGGMSCSAGKMYLAGNWENYGGYIFNSDTFEVLLTSEKDQTIHNKSSNTMQIPTLIIWNGNSRTVHLLGAIEIGEKKVLEGSAGKEVYSITYELDGGAVVGNPATYSTDTATFVLAHPVKEGYTFFGWTGSNGTIPQKMVTIEQGSQGNLTFIANWKPENYRVSYDLIQGDINKEMPIVIVPNTTYFKEFNQEWFELDLLQ